MFFWFVNINSIIKLICILGFCIARYKMFKNEMLELKRLVLNTVCRLGLKSKEALTDFEKILLDRKFLETIGYFTSDVDEFLFLPSTFVLQLENKKDNIRTHLFFIKKSMALYSITTSRTSDYKSWTHQNGIITVYQEPNTTSKVVQFCLTKDFTDKILLIESDVVGVNPFVQNQPWYFYKVLTTTDIGYIEMPLKNGYPIIKLNNLGF